MPITWANLFKNVEMFFRKLYNFSGFLHKSSKLFVQKLEFSVQIAGKISVTLIILFNKLWETYCFFLSYTHFFPTKFHFYENFCYI